MPYAMLNAVARLTSDQEKSLKTLKRFAVLEETNPQIGRIISQAKGELKKREALGKPVGIKFKALDGREVDISQMKDKLIFIDFWAYWCAHVFTKLQALKNI